MTIETRNNGFRDIIVLVADEGKILRRIGTEDVFGEEISLGKSWYINGEKLSKPHDDVPEDFEEIDAPEQEEEEWIEPEISDSEALRIITGK